MRDLSPQGDTALFQPVVQCREIGEARHELPQAMARVLHVLLDLSLLPASGRIAERWLEHVVVCHGKEPHVDLPFLPATDAVNRGARSTIVLEPMANKVSLS